MLTGPQPPAPDPPVPASGPAADVGSRPDVVVILTDDQRAGTLRRMPEVRSLLVRRGTRYSNAMVPTSLCCPSRATLLTGRYAHTTGVYRNAGRHGGWATFHRNGWEDRTVAVALRRAGYRTALIGKYLNQFGRFAPSDYRPPGWSRFVTFTDELRSGDYYGYSLSDGTEHGQSSADYSTDVLRDRAVDFIRTTPGNRRLFLLYTPYAPHSPYEPATRHIGDLEGVLEDYRPPSVTENVRDKPRWVRRAPAPSAFETGSLPNRQQETLLAVDEAVAAIVRSLRQTGRLRNTLIVYSSDNGYLWGEHGLTGKNVAYDAATRVPLVVRWDGQVQPGRTDGRLALNLDVTRTVTRVAEARMRSDGLDLLGAPRRHGFVVEGSRSAQADRPPYCGWRTHRWLFVRYSTGERELYDYARDRFETRNVVREPANQDVLRRLQAAAKEACVPTPPGFRW